MQANSKYIFIVSIYKFKVICFQEDDTNMEIPLLLSNCVRVALPKVLQMTHSAATKALLGDCPRT